MGSGSSEIWRDSAKHWKKVALAVAKGRSRDIVVLRRTQDHLRAERKKRRELEDRVRALETQRERFRGSETPESLAKTPDHYMGDMLVTCRRAMESVQAQPKVLIPSPMAFYWWACAFKYVWRCWGKNDTKRDLKKAVDCLQKAAEELPRCVEPVKPRTIVGGKKNG